jgi:hypothetical protein
VPLSYGHGYLFLPVVEGIKRIRNTLQSYLRDFRERDFENPYDPVGDGRVILAPDPRETIRQARREILLLKRQGDETAFEIFESLHTWRYVENSGPFADIDLATVVNDLGIVLRLLQTGVLPALDQISPTDILRVDAPTGATATAEQNADVMGNKGLVDRFIAKMKEAGRRITRRDIWRAAGYTERTEFQRFQRGDTGNETATLNFKRILSMEPEAFLELLRRRKKRS